MTKRKKTASQPSLGLALRLGLSVIAGLILLLAVCLLGAVLVEKGVLPRTTEQGIGLAGVALGGFLAGLLTALREQHRLMIYVGITTMGYTAALLLLGVVCFPAAWLDGGILFMLILSISGGCLGVLPRLKAQGGKKRRRAAAR